MNTKKTMTTKHIVLVALFTAMSVILSRVLVVYVLGGTKRISFASIPIFIGSLYLGPFYGGIIGALTDIIGSIMFPVGDFNILFTIAPTISGILPGLIMGKNYNKFPIKVVIICLIQAIIVVVINSYIFSALYSKKSFMEIVALRTPFSMFMVAVKSSILIPIIYKMKGFFLQKGFA